MKIEITAFGIAKEILGKKQIEMQLEDSSTVAKLRSILIDDFPEFEKLKSLKFAVNAEYVEDDFIISEQDEVVLIPPVSGG